MTGEKYSNLRNISSEELLKMPEPPKPPLVRSERSYGIPKDDNGNGGNNREYKQIHYNVTGRGKRIIKRPLARPRRKEDTKKLKNNTGKRRSKTKNRTRSRSRSRSRSQNRNKTFKKK